MSNLFSEVAKEFQSGNTDDVVDIITFVESPWGLNVTLLPVQKFILKCFYGLELDNGDKNIVVPDVTNEHILYKFNETQFLRWLYEEGRCNVDFTDGRIYQELILAVGRRGTKSSMASFISNYELYKLVKRGDPAKFYGFPNGTQVSILTVAPTDDQSGIVFEMIQRMAMQCPYMKDRSLHQTMTYFDVQTDADRKIPGRPKASLLSLTGGCSSKSLRGRNAIVVIMDEMAHFIDNAGRFSGSEVYKALTPSIADFRRDGKIISISSPYAKYGCFYDRYLQSADEQDITLMFKMYSAMVNPNIPPEILRAARRRDRVSFMCEYGGEFSDSVTAWIDDEHEFRRCITTRPMPTRGDRDTKYFMGIDLGFKNDGTAICVVHKDKKTNKIILDYANVWFSGSSDVWERDNSIYAGCTKYAKQDLLRMADIVAEVKELTRWFPIKAGIFDQSNGYGLAELFRANKMKQMEMKQFTDKLNHDVYQLTKMMYAEQLLEIFNHEALIKEMLSLEAERKSKNKILVRAPNRPGAHDDLSDALARAIWLCYTQNKDRPMAIATGAGGAAIGMGSRHKDIPGVQNIKQETQAAFLMRKKKQHGAHPRGLDKIKKGRSSILRG
jgi:phage terminase large subunit-like protein